MGILVFSLSNLSIAFKFTGNSIPVKLRDSACFLKILLILPESLSTGINALAMQNLKH